MSTDDYGCHCDPVKDVSYRSAHFSKNLHLELLYSPDYHPGQFHEARFTLLINCCLSRKTSLVANSNMNHSALMRIGALGFLQVPGEEACKWSRQHWSLSSRQKS